MKQVNLHHYTEQGALLFSALPTKKHNAEPGGFKKIFGNIDELEQWQVNISATKMEMWAWA